MSTEASYQQSLKRWNQYPWPRIAVSLRVLARTVMSQQAADSSTFLIITPGAGHPTIWQKGVAGGVAVRSPQRAGVSVTRRPSQTGGAAEGPSLGAGGATARRPPRAGLAAIGRPLDAG